MFDRPRLSRVSSRSRHAVTTAPHVLGLVMLAVTLATPSAAQTAAAPPSLALRKSDRIVLVGNTLAERQQLFNHFETQLATRFADLELTVRNLGWSADTLTLQPRPLNFGDTPTHLTRQRADVVMAFFGLNESFEGEAGLAAFTRDLDAYLRSHQDARYNGSTPPRVVLVSPIAHERLERLVHVDVAARNRDLARYTGAMRRVAAERGVTFVDLFTPTLEAMARAGRPLTINGIHLNEEGDRLVAALLLDGLGAAPSSMRQASAAEMRGLEDLRERIRDKNQQFFHRFRPVNAEYIVGRRVEPFGAVNFPGEMKQLDDMVAERERAIWAAARALQGLRYPAVAGTDSAEAARRQP